MCQLWIELAKSTKEFGTPEISKIITSKGIEELESQLHNIDIQKIQNYEKELHHDIMAHISAYSDICPNAAPFIHLGATSNYINDNCDLILIRNSFQLLLPKIGLLFDTIKNISLQYIDVPTLAYTHLQKAQLITIGKRFTMYNSEIYPKIRCF